MQIVGSKEEEAKGGRIRAILLANRATAFFRASKYEQGLADCTISLSLFPDNFKAVRTKGRIQFYLQEFEAAIADFQEAMKLAEAALSAEVSAILAELKEAEIALARTNQRKFYNILGRYMRFLSAPTLFSNPSYLSVRSCNDMHCVGD